MHSKSAFLHNESALPKKVRQDSIRAPLKSAPGFDPSTSAPGYDPSTSTTITTTMMRGGYNGAMQNMGGMQNVGGYNGPMQYMGGMQNNGGGHGSPMQGGGGMHNICAGGQMQGTVTSGVVSPCGKLMWNAQSRIWDVIRLPSSGGGTYPI